jgi:hypothetical protein
MHVGPHPTKKPLKTPVRPPVPTLPKKWKPISMQDDQTTNLKLAHHRSDTSCSQNHSISSEFSHPVTIAAGTNEVAMWALQLYIGLLPNFHSPFREPTASVFRAIFSHAHCHIYLIHAHIFDSLQILFTLGIWLFYVQVLAPHLSTSFLQVYT